MKNHISLFKRLKLSLEGYDIIKARSLFSGNFCDLDMLCIRNTDKNLLYFIKDGKTILKEGDYEGIYANESVFVVLNRHSNTMCCYDYNGNLKFSDEVNTKTDFYDVVMRFYDSNESMRSGKKFFIIANKDGTRTLYDGQGNLIYDHVDSISTIYTYTEAKLFEITMDNKVYIVNNESLIPTECDMVMYINGSTLPMLIGKKDIEGKAKDKDGVKINYQFISKDGNISPLQFMSISRSETMSAYRIQGFDDKYNFISGNDGKLFSKEWFFHATNFASGLVFAKLDQKHFYTLYKSDGTELELDPSIKIRSVNTNFGHVKLPNMYGSFALVNIRVTNTDYADKADRTNHAYYDKEVYMDTDGNIYDI